MKWHNGRFCCKPCTTAYESVYILPEKGWPTHWVRKTGVAGTMIGATGSASCLAATGGPAPSGAGTMPGATGGAAPAGSGATGGALPNATGGAGTSLAATGGTMVIVNQQHSEYDRHKSVRHSEYDRRKSGREMMVQKRHSEHDRHKSEAPSNKKHRRT